MRRSIRDRYQIEFTARFAAVLIAKGARYARLARKCVSPNETPHEERLMSRILKKIAAYKRQGIAAAKCACSPADVDGPAFAGSSFCQNSRPSSRVATR